MKEIKVLLKGYVSRKWLVTMVVIASAVKLPLLFHSAGVSDSVTLAAIGLITSMGVAYGVVNIKDSKPNG